MNRYVSIGGNNSGPGDSSSPWATFVYACQSAQPGDTVFVNAGTYYGGAEVAQSEVTYIGLDNPVIVGDGSRCCFNIEGKHHILIQGFTFTNNEGVMGWSEVSGVGIRDVGNVGGTSSHHITVDGCTFRDINHRPASPTSYGAPVIFYSYGKTSLGHGNCHHIIIINCRFFAGKLDTPNGTTGHSHINSAGNVEHILIKDNYFYHDYYVYNAGGSCIELSGNQTGVAEPDIPRKMVITGNVGEYVGATDTDPFAGVRFLVYLTASHDILIERNRSINFPAGILAVCETGYSVATSTERQWYRRNVFTGLLANGITIGTYSWYYTAVGNIWCTNNTLTKIVSGYSNVLLVSNNVTTFPVPIFGNCRISNNIINGTPHVQDLFSAEAHQYLQMTNNDLGGGINVTMKKIDKDLPPWYTPGLFGDYEPAMELDINGSPSKECRGAEELTWMRRLR